MLPACSPSKVRRSERSWYHQSGLRSQLPEGRRLAQLNVAVRMICEPVACRVVSVCWLPAFGAKLRRLARAVGDVIRRQEGLAGTRTSFSLRDCQASTRPDTSPCRRVSQGNVVKYVAKGRPVARQATAGHTGHSGMHFGLHQQVDAYFRCLHDSALVLSFICITHNDAPCICRLRRSQPCHALHVGTCALCSRMSRPNAK
jgi:hypothetical protein